MNRLLALISIWGMLFWVPQPPPVVHAVLFWSPGCAFCDEVIQNFLPPLQAKYGDMLQIQLVTLAGVDEVNALFDSAAALGLQKEQVVVPLLVVGSKVLAGQAAIEKEFPGLVQQGVIMGGIPVPQLPPALAELAARPTPTPRPTLATLGGIPPAPGVTPSPAPAEGANVGCAAGGTTGCKFSPTQPVPSATPPGGAGLLDNPATVAAAAAAGVLALAALAWFLISRRHSN